MSKEQPKNLIDVKKLPEAERKARASKAGKKSAEKRAEAKLFRELIRTGLECKTPEPLITAMRRSGFIPEELAGTAIDIKLAMALRLIGETISARKFDVFLTGYEEIRNSIGEKPRDIPAVTQNPGAKVSIEDVVKAVKAKREM
jgi:hypothetical protein